MARKIAVDLLKAKQADKVLVKLAYAIGKAEPVMASYEMLKNGQRQKGEISAGQYDLTPRGIIKFLELTKPQFREVAAWGSFGNGFKWDK